MTFLFSRNETHSRAWWIGAAAAVAALLLLVLLAVRRAWIGDDAYITLRTVDNFIHGYGLRWNVAERVQTYTHPLWMLLLSLFYAVTREGFYTTILLSLALAMSAAGLAAFAAARAPLSGALGVLILAMSSSFVDYTSSGLENALAYLLLVILCVLFWRLPASPRKVLWVSLLASLGMVNRMDSVLLVLPGVLLAFWQSRSRRALGALALGQLPFLLWEIFAVIYYGFLFPNTAYAKLNTGIPTAQLIHQGFVYLQDAWMRDPILWLTIGAGLATIIIAREWRSLALWVGVLLHLAYVVWVGGDFMGGRFLTAPFLLCVLLIARLNFSGSWKRYAWLGACALAAIVAGFSAATPSPEVGRGKSWDAINEKTGIADERYFYYKACGLITAGRKKDPPTFEWRFQGETLRRLDRGVEVAESVGMLGYFAGPRVHLVDKLALTDPLLARLPALYNPRWRIGHFKRLVPDGYVDTLRSGQNQLSDPRLSLYYEQLSLITRGALFSAQRWRAIWKMNSGQLDDLIDRDAYR